MPDESVRVAVRVRPFNSRERERNAKCIVQMRGATTRLLHPDTGKPSEYTFDFSYWSHDGFEANGAGYLSAAKPPASTHREAPALVEYASQDNVYSDLGRSMLESAWSGFNCCVFAYGQTGSGKSYSIVGYEANKGIIPMCCQEVFERKAEVEGESLRVQVEVCMLEIYNEKLRDLLSEQQTELKVRNGPKGTYVSGQRRVAVTSYEEIDACMERGTTNRTVASTNMNATSSRAHTVFTITLTQLASDGDGHASEISADINLVDLAGSERASSSGAQGTRLKEGS